MKKILFLLVELICVLTAAVVSVASHPPQLVSINVATTNSNVLPTNVTFLPRQNAYLVNVSSHDLFSIQYSEKLLQKVSKQAHEFGCNDIAVNGGPFQANGELVGGVVVNSQVVSNDFQKHNVGFGITTVGKWILGGIMNASQVESLGVQHYVTGLSSDGWLVYKGQVVVVDSHTSNHHVRTSREHIVAPRTAIGVDKDGHLLLLVVDGCEACLFRNRGMTLQELAETFQQLGVYHAINLDGGSSTTLIRNGSIVMNRPTCHDVVPWKCERPVATIVCLQRQQQQDNSVMQDGSKGEEESEEDA